jgi:hypothetical protein
MSPLDEGAGTEWWPEWLCTAWDGLQDGERHTLAGPWDSEIQLRLGTDLGTLLLRQRGLTVEQVIEAAGFFPNGLGSLRHYPGGVGKLIRELWDERDAAAARAEAERTVREEAGAGMPYRKLKPVGAANIPPRQWAYGKFLLFGVVAVLGAQDGAGKGVVATPKMLAMITGKPLLGEKVWRKGPVAIITYEDDEEEWYRRIAAACIKYELDYEYVLDNIYFIHKPDETKVTFGARDQDGTFFPDSDNIIKTLKHLGIVLLIIDPFNHAHDGDDGNNNVAIARVAAEVMRIAKATKAAVLVLHHLRKGASGHADDLMGALSLRATFRSCRILMRMLEEVAEKMKIADGAWRYIRIAGNKENYAPPPDKSTWFKLASLPLGNTGDETYPEGDDMGVAVTWEPRPMFEGMDAATLRAVFQALRDTIHGSAKQAKHTPWAGKALMNAGGRSEIEAGKILKAWVESGVLIEGRYNHKDSRNEVGCVTVNDTRAAEILAEMEV